MRQSGQKFVWQHHGTEGPVAHLVTLGLEQEPDKIRARSQYLLPTLSSLSQFSRHLVPRRQKHSAGLF